MTSHAQFMTDREAVKHNQEAAGADENLKEALFLLELAQEKNSQNIFTNQAIAKVKCAIEVICIIHGEKS